MALFKLNVDYKDNCGNDQRGSLIVETDNIVTFFKNNYDFSINGVDFKSRESTYGEKSNYQKFVEYMEHFFEEVDV